MDSALQEHALGGGNMNDKVVRVGDTVRRGASDWSPTIQRLLTHIRDAGVDWVPRFHGFDDDGREILDYIEGEVAHGEPEWMRTDQVLEDVARAQRQWHDATVSFEHSRKDPWFLPGRLPHEVIAHNDFAEDNHVFRNGRFVGAIDFDVCYPASRLWDMAYTAYRYVPLIPLPGAAIDDGEGADRSPFDMETTRARLDTFLTAYGAVGRGGIAGDDEPKPYAPIELLTLLPSRLDEMADWCSMQTNEDARRNGHMYRAHARWVEFGEFDAF